jgi:hypothetical protein
VLLRSYADEFEKTYGNFLYRRPPDCHGRPSDDPVVVEYIEHNLIMTYAAGAAERLFFPHAHDYGDDLDIEIADEIIDKLHRSKKDRQAYRDHCQREARKLVKKHRDKIELVAAALERWRVLTDYEVYWLINKPRVFAKREREWPRVRREPTWRDFPGWRRLDRSRHWREERRRQREGDTYFNEENGDFYG